MVSNESWHFDASSDAAGELATAFFMTEAVLDENSDCEPKAPNKINLGTARPALPAIIEPILTVEWTEISQVYR